MRSADMQFTPIQHAGEVEGLGLWQLFMARVVQSVLLHFKDMHCKQGKQRKGAKDKHKYFYYYCRCISHTYINTATHQ